MLGGLVLFLLVPAIGGAEVWKRLSNLPEGNGGFVCGILKHNPVVAGGTNWREGKKYWLDQVWQYDGGKNKWLIKDKLPKPIGYAGFDYDSSGIYLTGGSDGSVVHPELFVISPELTVTKAPYPGIPVIYAGTALVRGDFYILQGFQDLDGKKVVAEKFYKINIASGKMTRLSDFPDKKNVNPALVFNNGSLYAFGGSGVYEKKQVLVDTAYAYSIKQNSWHAIRSFPYPVNYPAVCALNGRFIMVAGGYKTDDAVSDKRSFSDRIFIYDIRLDTYQECSIRLPYPAQGHGLLKTGRKIFLFGGEDIPCHRSNLFYVADWPEIFRTR